MIARSRKSWPAGLPETMAERNTQERRNHKRSTSYSPGNSIHIWTDVRLSCVCSQRFGTHSCATHYLLLPPQAQFIQFTKTLYNIFHGDPEEESLYRAVAHVTSLLLRMEEVGRKLQEPSSPHESSKPASAASAAPEVDSQSNETSPTPESYHSSQDNGSELSEMEWSFSFEQVLASLLNEPAIVTFFERPIDFHTKQGQAKVAQLRLSASKKMEV